MSAHEATIAGVIRRVKPRLARSSFRWLQAASFSLRIAKRGSDPIDSMRAEDVVLTITTAAPFSRVRPHVRALTVARDAIPAVRMPRRYFGLEESAMLGGGLVSITVWFGSRSAATRLLPVVNSILCSLREQPR
jgi:hypothetical protein